MATIAEIAAGSDDFNILVNALGFIDDNIEGSDLLGTLGDAGQSLTVFAPNDGAFGQLASDLGFAGDVSDEGAVTSFLATTLGAETLSDVVLYHVTGGVQDAAAVTAASTLTMLNGDTLSPDVPMLIDGEPDLADPTLVATDIAADNGIVHVIDRVLLPDDLPGNGGPTIADIATGSDDFNVLVNALGFIDDNIEGSDLIGTLSDESQSLTVFAPTDAAFGQLAADLGFDGDTMDDGAVTTFLATTLGAETLNDVVLYHVAAGTLLSGDVAGAEAITALNGDTITPDLPTLVDGEPDLIDATLTSLDNEAKNGVVHIIDRVLLPDDLPGNDVPTIAGIVAASGDGFDADGGDFDMLLAAVGAAGLVDALNNPDADLTVFAPNDAAFVGLAQTLGYTGTDEAGAFDFIVDAAVLLAGETGAIPLLSDILLYHVAGESLQSGQVLAADGIATLQGGTLTLEGTSIVDAEPNLPNPGLAALDIQAANGIVHVIDGVLVPVVLPFADPTSGVEFIVAADTADDITTGDADDLIDGNGGDDTIDSGAGDDFVNGGDGADSIMGGQGDDNVKGGTGDDVVDGGAGNDHVAGMDGNDSLLGGGGDDTFGGGQGNDTILGGAGDDNMGGGDGDDSLSGGTDDDQISGGAGADMLNGDGGDDTMGGSFGHDDVIGGAGDDSLGGGAGADTLEGNDGDDSIGGGLGEDNVFGNDGDDFLAGGAGDDLVVGGAGDDHLNGGTGDDSLTGDAGADLFIFNDLATTGNDTITDFEDGVDSFRISGVDNADGSGLQGYVDALNIMDVEGGAQLSYEGATVLIEGVMAADLTLEDFTFL